MKEQDIKKVQREVGVLEAQIAKQQKIATREKKENTSYRDKAEEYEIPPYSLTEFVTFSFADKFLIDKDEQAKMSTGRKIASKIWNATSIALIGVPNIGLTAILDTLISAIPAGVCKIESMVCKRYNRNIDKASDRVKKMSARLEERRAILKELTELSKQEEVAKEEDLPELSL